MHLKYCVITEIPHQEKNHIISTSVEGSFILMSEMPGRALAPWTKWSVLEEDVPVVMGNTAN